MGILITGPVILLLLLLAFVALLGGGFVLLAAMVRWANRHETARLEPASSPDSNPSSAR
jgi:hypothetical protein